MHPDVYSRPLLWVLAALIFALAAFYCPAPSKRDVFHFIGEKSVTLTGRAESFPVSKKDARNVIVKVFSVDGRPAGGYVYARLKNFDPRWKDELEITGRLQAPYGVGLLGNFNWREYLALKNVFTEIKTSEARVLRPAALPQRIIRAVRENILRVFYDSFPPELAGIAGGILLGERGEQTPELYAAFQDSGAIHLLVASGGNVGFVTLITLGICSFFAMGRRKILPTALFVAGIYTLVAGADAPLVRAYFMAVCACTGYFLGRNSGVFQGLLVSCLVILAFHPAAVFETGFQMSFLATLAIIICLSNWRPPGSWPRAARFFAQIFLATLASQLVLLPVFTNVFYKVSVTGLLSNMILVPLAAVVMGLSFAFWLVESVSAGIVLYYPTLWSLELFKALVEFFASFGWSSLPVSAWRAGTVVSYYAVLFFVFNLPLKNFVRKIAWPCALLAAGAPLAQYAFFSSARVYLLNEWNQNAAVVRMKNGDAFLLGGENLAPEKLARALYKAGVRRATAALAFSGLPGKYAPQETGAENTVIPFSEEMWPGQTRTYGRTRVRMEWGLHETRDGRFWENAGYSGTSADDVSYCFSEDGKEFCVGARASFVREGKRVVRSERNRTVLLKI